MAKKKKLAKSSKSSSVPLERSPTYSLVWAAGMFLLGLILLLGGFNTGGFVPVKLFHLIYVVFGWASYILPFGLFYLSGYIFKSEEHQFPRGKLIGLIAVLLFSSGLFDSAFVVKNSAGSWVHGHGGFVGQGIGALGLMAFAKIPASIIFFIISLVALVATLGIAPATLLNLLKGFKSKEAEEGELAALKAKAGDQSDFKLNEGVPVEHHTPNDQPSRFTSLRNTAQKLSQVENHEALTTTSDASWQFPTLDLLNQKLDKADAGNVSTNAKIIRDTFNNFNIEVEMEGANIGPRVTQYTLKPPTGVKLTKITALDNNLALDLAATSIRIEAPIPGKRAVGIEVPNIKAATVRIFSMFTSKQWQEQNSPLALAIGKDISGTPVVADLDKMPHLLIAGQTGSGKSVIINSILTSLLYRNSPSDLKLILVDPKQVELKPYDEIPHLLAPVVTNPEQCISALKWAVAEMERRYRTLADVGKRNISEYNSLKKEEGMPYIVIVIDELADLMMMAARDVEALVVRVAQKARAVGIHLVLATQRPSVDVITGLIKANIPARIAFKTTSQVDSRTIIDQVGAEKLLGQGDMLMTLADAPKPKRIQGALIEESETAKVIDFLKMQRPPQYDDEVVSQPVQLGKGGLLSDAGQGDDDLFKDAVQVVIDNRKASTSLLQRRLRIGYGRAARLIEALEDQGIIGAADGSRPREVLVHSVDEIYNDGEDAPAEPVETPEQEVV